MTDDDLRRLIELEKWFQALGHSLVSADLPALNELERLGESYLDIATELLALREQVREMEGEREAAMKILSYLDNDLVSSVRMLSDHLDAVSARCLELEEERRNSRTAQKEGP